MWQAPRLDERNRVVAGVAAGTARELGVDPIIVRVSFVLLTIAGGWGLALYLIGWVILSRATPGPYTPIEKGREPHLRTLAFGMITLGLMLFTRVISPAFVDELVWPIALVGGAVAFVFGRNDGPGRFRLSRTGADVSIRILGGIALVVASIVLAITLNFDVETARNALLVVGLVTAGFALVVAPWATGVGQDLMNERRLRIRSEERSEMAAHLHDSVLQTLTLIQKRSGDAEVVALARRQERELRTWLFGRQVQGPGGLRTGLEHHMSEVEERHAVPVEVIVVGDLETSENVEALLAATREAAMNAARHSGAPRIDVFAEVSATGTDVFVRDQGSGFDPDTIESDRAGVRDSIIGRMERAGGSATISSAPGRGTEVELHLPGGSDG